MKTSLYRVSIKSISAAALLFCFAHNLSGMQARLLLVRSQRAGARCMCSAQTGRADSFAAFALVFENKMAGKQEEKLKGYEAGATKVIDAGVDLFEHQESLNKRVSDSRVGMAYDRYLRTQFCSSYAIE